MAKAEAATIESHDTSRERSRTSRLRNAHGVPVACRSLELPERLVEHDVTTGGRVGSFHGGSMRIAPNETRHEQRENGDRGCRLVIGGERNRSMAHLCASRLWWRDTGDKNLREVDVSATARSGRRAWWA